VAALIVQPVHIAGARRTTTHPTAIAAQVAAHGDMPTATAGTACRMHATTHRSMHATTAVTSAHRRPATATAGAACYGRSAKRKGERANHRDYRY
jgi:hypothetical protein